MKKENKDYIFGVLFLIRLKYLLKDFVLIDLYLWEKVLRKFLGFVFFELGKIYYFFNFYGFFKFFLEGMF